MAAVNDRRFWITENNGDRFEVTRAYFILYERKCGFTIYPNELATSGFHGRDKAGNDYRGEITYE